MSKKQCLWIVWRGRWESGCIHDFGRMDGTDPGDAGFKFCPYCGKTLVMLKDLAKPKSKAVPQDEQKYRIGFS